MYKFIVLSKINLIEFILAFTIISANVFLVVVDDIIFHRADDLTRPSNRSVQVYSLNRNGKQNKLKN